MKAFLFVAMLLSATAQAEVAADPDNTKLRIALKKDETHDCKLSLREISRFDGRTVGKRYLCAQLIDVNSEISFSTLKSLIENNEVSVTYGGANAQSLVATFVAWQNALVADASGYLDPNAHIASNAPWTFEVVGEYDTSVSLKMLHTQTGSATPFRVLMKQKIVTSVERE